MGKKFERAICYECSLKHSEHGCIPTADWETAICDYCKEMKVVRDVREFLDLGVDNERM